MKWEIKDELKILEGYASQYTDPIDALYEFVKNLEDEGANEIYVELDSKHRKLYIYGNSQGMTLEKFTDMVKSIGRSSKSERNFGVGLIGFLRIGSQLKMLSKTDKYVFGSCFRRNDQLWSDPDPHYLLKSETKSYEDLIKRLHIWKHGTITLIENVGRSKSQYFPMDFEFEDKTGFGRIRVENVLIKKIKQKLAHIKYIMSYDNNKQSLNKKALGRDCLSMVIPSPKIPFINSQGEKRNIFSMNGFNYEIETKLRVETKADSKNALTISFFGQDALPCQIACKDMFSLPKTSLFRENDNTKYLDGWVDFNIKPIDGGAIPKIYSLNRNSMNFPEPLEKVLANILRFTEEEALEELVDIYVNKMCKGKNKAASDRLNNTMHALYVRFASIFSEVLLQNVDKVQAPSKTKCQSCGLEVVATKGRILSKKELSEKVPPKEEKIINDTIAGKYQCLWCGAKWEHREYTRPIWTGKEKKKKPFYDGTRAEKERQRRRGFGYQFEVEPIPDDKVRRWASSGTRIIVNTNHPNHQYLSKKYKTYKDPLHRYENKIALIATFSNSDEAKKMPEHMFRAFEEFMVCLDIAEAEGMPRGLQINPDKDAREIQNIDHGEKLAQKWAAKFHSRAA